MKRRWYLLRCYCFFTVIHDLWVCLSFLDSERLYCEMWETSDQMWERTLPLFLLHCCLIHFFTPFVNTPLEISRTLHKFVGNLCSRGRICFLGIPTFLFLNCGLKEDFHFVLAGLLQVLSQDRQAFISMHLNYFQWSYYLSFIYAFELYSYLSREDRFLLTNVSIYYKISESFIDKKPYINQFFLEEAEM